MRRSFLLLCIIALIIFDGLILNACHDEIQDNKPLSQAQTKKVAKDIGATVQNDMCGWSAGKYYCCAPAGGTVQCWPAPPPKPANP